MYPPPPQTPMSVLAFFKYLSLPSSCVYKRACTYLKAKSEVPVHAFLRPLGTSGFCYALCDLSVAVLCPRPPIPALWEGRVMTQCGWLHFPGLLLVRLSTPLLGAGDGLQPTGLLFFFNLPPILAVWKRWVKPVATPSRHVKHTCVGLIFKTSLIYYQ